MGVLMTAERERAVNATPEHLLAEVNSLELKPWHDLCAPCTEAFRAWQCAPNPGNWAKPAVQANPQLLAWLASCRVTGPSPAEWRETISRQLLLIRRICTDNKDGTHGEYTPPPAISIRWHTEDRELP